VFEGHGYPLVYIIICIKATHMFATCTFDLWMFIQVHNVFTVVINFVSSNWEPKHMSINLFEAIEISGVAMAPKLWAFFMVEIFAVKLVAAHSRRLCCFIVLDDSSACRRVAVSSQSLRWSQSRKPLLLLSTTSLQRKLSNGCLGNKSGANLSSDWSPEVTSQLRLLAGSVVAITIIELPSS